MSSKDSSPDRGPVARVFRFALDTLLGIIVGVVLTIITTDVLLYVEAKSVFTTVNGWSTTMLGGRPGHSFLLRALLADELPDVSVAKEQVYWIAGKDGNGQRLDGGHDYVLRFAPGELPPNRAFWSLEMTNAKKALVANSINRYSLGDQSGLVANSDGSIDIYIQNAAPTGHETNWLPAPAGHFILWLRVYEPGKAILDGSYRVPPVVEVK